MKKSIRWRLGLILLSVVVALFLSLPSTPIQTSLPEWWKQSVPKIALGLDLRGGSYLVMQIETEKAVEAYMDNIAADLQNTATSQGLAVSFMRTGQDVTAKFAESLGDRVAEFVKKTYAVLDPTSGGKGELVYSLKQSNAYGLKENAVQQAKERTERRINKFGVTEPNVYRQGRDQMVIQLPGIKNPQEAISFIKTAGRLEFKLVAPQADIQKALSGKIPANMEILYEEIVDDSGKISRKPLLLYKQTLLTGDRLKEARVAIDDRGRPDVDMTFDDEGARTFDRITGEHVGQQLAIVLDGVVQSAPTIQDRISGGRAQITSPFFTHESAAKLAFVLRESLPAPMKVIQNVTVGPSLGQDSINKGVRAALIGGLFVIIFMAFYYRLSGVIADYAIVLNLVLLLGAMALLNATLTLPGIAGIILTIGMGVDSNVLMFERIREEVRAGKDPRPSVDAGYDKAFLTILDSHVTTLITAGALFLFGTGPIKGFAVTLSLGIIINLYSALVGTKVIFDIINSRWKLKKLSI
jgi:preprotein translocase subunit SecD